MSVYKRIILGFIAALFLTLGAGVSNEAAAYPVNEVLRKDHDVCGREALLRRGYFNKPSGRGFGFDKMYHKHNLKRQEVFSYVLRNPNCGRPEGGYTRKYTAYAHKFECSIFECKLVDRRKVLMIINYGTDPTIPGQKGVITAYCEGETRCASWVDESINLNGLRSGNDKQRIGWSYAPMGKERGYKPADIPTL